MNKRDSKYKDGLDIIEKEKIKTLPEPWQRSFVEHFYKQLQKSNLTKKEICDKINDSPCNYRLNPSYRLFPNTLSQYTNFNSNEIRPININGLIAISNALGVSINYLLGIDTCENPENTDINKITGLCNDSIEVLKENKKLQELLNIVLLSPKLSDLMKQISNIFYSEYVSKDLLDAYSIDLKNHIELAYLRYETEIFPLDKSQEKFEQVLSEQIPYNSIVSISEYLKNNVSEDRFYQISNFYDVKDGYTLYTAFIKDTSNCVYDILSYKGNSDFYKNRLFKLFDEILDDFMYKKSVRIRTNLKHSFNKY